MRAKTFLKSREFLLLIIILAMLLLVSTRNAAFISAANIVDMLRNSAYVTIAAVGMSMIIITGGIDVSMGAVMSALAITCGNMALAGVPLPVWIVITIILGGLAGAMNGFFISRFHIPPMVCSLAVSSIVSGALIIVTGGLWVYGTPESFNLIGKGMIGPIPVSVIIMVVVLIWATWFMSSSRLGRAMYAIGGNPSAAELTAIPVKKVLLLTYTIGGILLAIATIVYSTRLTSITSDCGTGFHMTLIAAAIIGGTNILGGSGKPIGVFLGAFVLELFRASLTYLEISTYWEQAVRGALILIAVLFGVIKFSGKRKVVADASNS